MWFPKKYHYNPKTFTTMNTNFDKQRFGKCLKYRLTDRFMITYSICGYLIIFFIF